jgi:hypothetical protein
LLHITPITDADIARLLQDGAMLEADSLIKARYALTILRVAQAADRQTAARLVSGLVRDFPHPDERPEIARIHVAAINLFARLATALNDPTDLKRQSLWASATDAVNHWLRAVGG